MGRGFAPLLSVPTPIIFICATTLALVFLWGRGDLTFLGQSLRAADPRLAVGIFIGYTLSILVLGLRWHTLVRVAEGSPPWTASAEVFLTSVIVNYAAPIGLAVPTRAALTVRDLGMAPGQSGAVVAWEVALDVGALTAISGLWLALGGADLVRTLPVDANVVLLGGVGIVAAIALGLAIARRSPLHARITPFLSQLLSGPGRHPALSLLAVVLTVAFWCMQIGVMAGLLQVLGASSSPGLLVGLMGLPVLIGMLSPVPGGAGVREALMAAVARLEGVPAGPVILAAVAYRLALFAVTPMVWGMVRMARLWLNRR